MGGTRVPLHPSFYPTLEKPECQGNTTLSPWKTQEQQMIYMGLLQYVNNNGIHDFPLEYLPPNWCQGDKYQMPDQGPILLIFAAVSMAVTAAVVITRFLTRLFVGGRIGWDDWTILAATVVLACHTAVAILGVDVAGIGKHFYDVEFEDLETILKIMFASAMVYSINVFIVKASLLFFYKRLFGAGYPGMQRFINVFIVFLALYAVGSCLGFAFQCNPVHAYWSLQQRTTNCTSLEKSVVIYRTIRAISVTCEVVILILPMRYVFSLTLPLKHRLGLAILFGMGSIAIIAAMVRMVLHPMKNLDISWNMFPVILAAQLEHSLGIITASIPALTALFSQSTSMNSKQNQYISADSIELGGHKGDGKSATIHHGRPRVNDTDFLQWAYDPERKNGNYSSTAYAYSPSKAERKATKKLGLSSLGLKSHTRPRTSEGSRNERTSGDGGSGMNMHGLGIAPSHSGQDSNENLVQMAFHSNQDPNAILKTSTVEVKVYSRS